MNTLGWNQSQALAGQRPLVVAIGASNLSRGLGRLVTASRQWSRGPVDLLAAAGHGRSFGANSRVWNRRLPSILGSGLWRSLDRLLDARGQPPGQPRVAIVTDIGNDLLYGFSVQQLVGWVEETLSRLHERGFQVAVTRLPIASIGRVGPVRYRLLKTLFVPGCPLSCAEIIAAAQETDGAVLQLAASLGIDTIGQPGEWYGFDAMHLRRPCLDLLWQRAAASWGDAGTPAGNAGSSTCLGRWWAWARVGAAGAEVRSLSRVMRFTRQPVVEFQDTTRVFLY